MTARHAETTTAGLFWLTLAIGWSVFLLFAATLPPLRALELAGGGSETGWDKLLHAATFLVLGVLIRIAASRIRGRTRPAVHTKVAAAAGTAYASLHEGMQLWLPGFTFNFADLLADLIGLYAGIGIAALAGERRVRISAGS